MSDLPVKRENAAAAGEIAAAAAAEPVTVGAEGGAPAPDPAEELRKAYLRGRNEAIAEVMAAREGRRLPAPDDSDRVAVIFTGRRSVWEENPGR